MQVAVPPSWMLVGEAETVITGFGTGVGASGRGQGWTSWRTDFSDSGLAGTALAIDTRLSINTISVNTTVCCFGSPPLPARSFLRLCLFKPKPPA